MAGHDKFGSESEDRTVMVQSFTPGSFFADRYQVESVLGTGAMGKVYACTDLPTGRRVALKVLHKERLGEPETVERFRREAEVLASIGHKCIVEVHAFHHTSDGTPYLAMELLEGVTLKRRLQAGGRFQSPADFQEILDCICSALGAAHARGVVHRDMKPDNVFLPASGDPRAKLVDFGLSRLADAKKVTHSGMLLGTPRYMAPEQLRSAADAEPRVDIYSVGVMIFEALTGESPYPASDYGQLLGCLIEGRVRPFEELRPDLPRSIGDVIRKAMAQDPNARFPTTAALAEAYGAAIGSPSRHAALSAAPSSASGAQRRPRISTSQQNMPATSEKNTLAFDVSAGSLADALSPLRGSPVPGAALPKPATMPNFGGGAVSSPGVGGTTPGMPSQALLGPQASFQASSPAPLPAAPVHDGSTVFMGAVGPIASPAPPHSAQAALGSHPGAGPAPQSVRPAAPAAAFHAPHPPKKRRRGVLLFLVAMVVVVALSAAGGFALRAYVRGELQIPGTGSR
ncbi:MAG: protein kinase [Sandaracinaceae bacterium]|nr:protein kinase [Sandaracinaceae bacterium]